MGFFKAGRMVDGYSSLRVGMTKTEVIALLGQPNGQRTRDGIETLSWSNTEFKGLFRGGNIERRIFVDFIDDKVIGWDGEHMSASRW